MATITITNINPSTPPTGGSWVVGYRVKDSGAPYTESTGHIMLPIVITTADPINTEYEGYIKNDCGSGNFSTSIPWTLYKCGGFEEYNFVSDIFSIGGYWHPIPSVDHYKIEYKLHSSPTWIVFNNNYHSTSFTINGLLCSTAYDVRVTAVCSNGLEFSIQEIEKYTTECPSCQYPNPLVVTGVTTSSISVGWDPVIGAVDYFVEYKKVSDISWTVFGSVATTSAVITGLDDNTSYNIRVKTNCGGMESSYATTTGTTAKIPDVCNPITGLTITDKTETSITADWNDVVGALNYYVEYKKTSDATWVSAGNSYNSDITISGLDSNTSYDIRVRTNCSEGQTSGFTSIMTSTEDTCHNVTNLHVISSEETTLSVDWDDVPGAISYRVEYKKISDATWIFDSNVYNSGIYLVGLEPSTTYNVRVRTNCSGGRTSGYEQTTGVTADPVIVCTDTIYYSTPPVGTPDSHIFSVPCREGEFFINYTVTNPDIYQKGNIEVIDTSIYPSIILASHNDLESGTYVIPFDKDDGLCNVTVRYYTSVPVLVSNNNHSTFNDACADTPTIIKYTTSTSPSVPFINDIIYNEPSLNTKFDGGSKWRAYQVGGSKYAVKINSLGVITDVQLCVSPPAPGYNLVLSNKSNIYPLDVITDAFGDGNVTRVWTGVSGSLPVSLDGALYANITPGTYNFRMLLGIGTPSLFPMPRKRIRVIKNGVTIIDNKFHSIVAGGFTMKTGSFTIGSNDMIVIQLG